jgi:hypothetical protein
MIAVIVRFRSRMTAPEVLERYRERAPKYRALPGLLQKFYLEFLDGLHGAVYLWDSPQSLEAFRASELARTIPEAYQVEGKAEMQVAEVAMTLREGATVP